MQVISARIGVLIHTMDVTGPTNMRQSTNLTMEYHHCFSVNRVIQ